MELQVEKEQVSPVEYALKVTVPAETVAEHVESAINMIAHKAQVPGFRVGKVPRSIVIQKYGSSITTDTIQHLLQESYKEALEQAALFPVTPGQMSDVKFDEGSPLSYTVKVEVLPEFELPDLSEITVEKLLPQAEDDDVMMALDNLREANSTALPTDEGATAESMIQADFQELDPTGLPVIGKVQRDIDLDLRRVNLGEDFASKITGVKAGQSIVAEIPMQTAENEPPKTAKMQITVKSVKERELPPLDDDFARQINPQTESLESLKSDLKNFIEARAGYRARDMMLRSVVESMLRKVDFPAPPSLVEDYLERATQDATQRAKTKPSEQEITEFKSKQRASAIWNMRWYLLRDRLVREQKLEISPLEFDAEVDRLAAVEGFPIEEFKTMLTHDQKHHIREDLMERKVFQFLEDQVQIVPRKISLAEFEGRKQGKIVTV